MKKSITLQLGSLDYLTEDYGLFACVRGVTTFLPSPCSLYPPERVILTCSNRKFARSHKLYLDLGGLGNIYRYNFIRTFGDSLPDWAQHSDSGYMFDAAKDFFQQFVTDKIGSITLYFRIDVE
jgi:hypothetical protein